MCKPGALVHAPLASGRIVAFVVPAMLRTHEGTVTLRHGKTNAGWPVVPYGTQGVLVRATMLPSHGAPAERCTMLLHAYNGTATCSAAPIPGAYVARAFVDGTGYAVADEAAPKA